MVMQVSLPTLGRRRHAAVLSGRQPTGASVRDMLFASAQCAGKLADLQVDCGCIANDLDMYHTTCSMMTLPLPNDRLLTFRSSASVPA
jgi:hypothetical protein